MKEMRIGIVCQPVHPTRAEIKKAIDEHFEKHVKDGMSRKPTMTQPMVVNEICNEKCACDNIINPMPEEDRRKM